jgi:hypothetical protein
MTTESALGLIGMIDHQLIALLSESIKENNSGNEEPNSAYWMRIGKRVALENLKLQLENIVEYNRYALKA